MSTPFEFLKEKLSAPLAQSPLRKHRNCRTSGAYTARHGLKREGETVDTSRNTPRLPIQVNHQEIGTRGKRHNERKKVRLQRQANKGIPSCHFSFHGQEEASAIICPTLQQKRSETLPARTNHKTRCCIRTIRGTIRSDKCVRFGRANTISRELKSPVDAQRALSDDVQKSLTIMPFPIV